MTHTISWGSQHCSEDTDAPSEAAELLKRCRNLNESNAHFHMILLLALEEQVIFKPVDVPPHSTCTSKCKPQMYLSPS